MQNDQIHYIELQVGVPLPQAWPWRAVALAIGSVLVLLFLWSMPVRAGGQIKGTSAETTTTTLQGFDINTMAFRIKVSHGVLIEPLRTRATDMLKSALGWKEPTKPTSTLFLDLSTDSKHSGSPGKVIMQWSLRLSESTTIRGFDFTTLTYDVHQGGPTVQPAPAQAELEAAVDYYIGRFIDAYRIGNKHPSAH